MCLFVPDCKGNVLISVLKVMNQEFLLSIFFISRWLYFDILVQAFFPFMLCMCVYIYILCYTTYFSI